MVLVTGGTGVLGSRVVRQLLDQGKDVRVLTRHPGSEKAIELQARGAQLVTGDVCDHASIPPALEGVDELVIAVHALAGPGTSRENNPHTCDRDGVHALIDAAEVAGVRHVVYVSIFGASPEAAPEFVRIKYETEEYLKNSGMSWTILRPAAFMEVWADMIGGPVIRGEKTMVFGDGNNPVNFVSADDVAAFAIIALEDPEARGQLLTIGGPEDFTLNEVVGVFAQAVRSEAKVQKTPVPMMKTLSAVLGPFNPGLSRQMAMGAWMATTNQRIDMTDVLKLFPIKLTRLQDVAAKMVADSRTSVREPAGA
jgi:uncharacterized protein YbjT (DUF2867 family)